MKKKRTMRRYCKTCAHRTYHSKTRDPSVIVCMRCGAKNKEIVLPKVNAINKIKRDIQYES